MAKNCHLMELVLYFSLLGPYWRRRGGMGGTMPEGGASVWQGRCSKMQEA